MDLLKTGNPYRLVLVISPNGSGRTALLREWARQQAKGEETRVARLSLEEADNQPERFLLDLDQALRLALYPSPIPDPSQNDYLAGTSSCIKDPWLENALAERINVIAKAPGKLVIVLENYEVITSAEIHQAVALLLDYIPPQTLVVIVCDCEPPLPLARLRVRRQMLELTIEELTYAS